VPFDSSGTSLYYTDLRFSQSFNGFAFDYVSDKRTKWKTAVEFERTFNVTDDLIQRFAVFAQKEMKIQIVKSELNHSKKLIAKTLKAEIARQLWLEDAYYKIVNQEDNEFQKAISTLLK
jgi:carboxyl-terminal processing protease